MLPTFGPRRQGLLSYRPIQSGRTGRAPCLSHVFQHFLPHSTGHTGSSKNCQGKRAVLKVFWSARYCGNGGQVGSYHRDEIREISGTFSAVYGGYPLAECTGCITSVYLSDEGQGTVPQSQANNMYTMSAARVVPTGPENVPQHYLQPIALYLGRPAEI